MSFGSEGLVSKLKTVQSRDRGRKTNILMHVCTYVYICICICICIDVYIEICLYVSVIEFMTWCVCVLALRARVLHQDAAALAKKAGAASWRAKQRANGGPKWVWPHTSNTDLKGGLATQVFSFMPNNPGTLPLGRQGNAP